MSALGIKASDKISGFHHPPPFQGRPSQAFCPQRSDPFHHLAAAVASFSSSLALGWIFCLDSPFPPQQTPRALSGNAAGMAMPKLLMDGACDPCTTRVEIFFLKTTSLSLPVHPHPSYPFLQLQRSQKSLCWCSEPLSHPSPALCSLHQLGERGITSFRDSFCWECSKAGASGQVFPTSELSLLFFLN